MPPSAPLPHRAPRPHARRTSRRALPLGASRSGKAGGPSAPLPHRLRTAGEATEAGCRAPSAVARRWSPRRAQRMRTSSVSLEMRWQESKSRSHQMREGESIGRWYRAIPPHRMWIGWDALQYGGQGLATDAEPRARLRRLDLAAAQLDWPAFGAQRCYFSDDAIFSRPALAQPSSTKPLGAPPTPMLPITSSPDLINTAPGSNRIPGTLVSAAAAGLAASCATSSLCRSFLKISPSVTSVESPPLPSRPVPRHTAFALRIMSRLRARLLADGKLANALGRRREDRIGERRHHARGARFADATGRLQVLDQVHADPRRLVDAQHAVIAEVGLLDATVLDRDLPMERGRQAENDAALHLRANRVGIHLDTAIDHAPYVRRVDGTILVDANLSDLGDEAAEADAQRNAAALSCRQGFAPAGLRRRELQDGFRTRILVQQGDSVGKWILLRVGRELVHEALDRERPARHAHATPPRSRYSRRRFLRDPVDMNIADPVRLICNIHVDWVAQ